eukprot:8127271-Ditylum_brightwellii.AAC.1
MRNFSYRRYKSCIIKHPPMPSMQLIWRPRQPKSYREQKKKKMRQSKMKPRHKNYPKKVVKKWKKLRE